MDDQADGGTGPSVVRSEFSTTDADIAQEFLDAGYTTANKLTIAGIAEDFTFTHSALTAPAVSINTLQIGVDFTNDACAGPDDPVTAIQVSAARLREVIDFLDTHADRPIGPVTIAELAGMPAAEIVEGLRRRGVHPAQLLWRARLRGARRDLLDADPAPARVRAVAARWGFAHLGRFRIAYRRVFDETPEQTEQR